MHPELLNRPLFVLKAIAGHCGVSVNVLRKWIKEKAFPAAKDPCWMTTTGKIAEWAEGKRCGQKIEASQTRLKLGLLAYNLMYLVPTF